MYRLLIFIFFQMLSAEGATFVVDMAQQLYRRVVCSSICKHAYLHCANAGHPICSTCYGRLVPNEEDEVKLCPVCRMNVFRWQPYLSDLMLVLRSHCRVCNDTFNISEIEQHEVECSISHNVEVDILSEPLGRVSF